MSGDEASSAWYSNPGVLLDTLRRVEQSTIESRTPEIPGYQDLLEIARGGQGVVFSAVQASTSRRVAIKLLTPSSEHDERARRRFTREVNLAARLRHPNIVRIYDSGSTRDGRLYCVMDFIEGGSLRDRLNALRSSEADNSPGLDETLRLFHTIVVALSAAHQRGVIHRDLKPSNIRVDSAGAPHLLDFGLAKAVEGGDTLSGSAPTITEGTGHFAGSLPWASPEQVSGSVSEIDVRTDIYSVGVMLHHALTGEFPYDVSGSIRQTLNAIAESEPAPVRSVRPGLGRDLETVILTCLAKDQAKRYQSASALAEDLRRVIAGEPILAQADSAWRAVNRSLRRYRAVAAAVGVGGVVLAVLSVVMSLLYTRAVRAEQATQHEATHATTVNQFLQDMLASPTPGNLGRDVSVREMVDRASVQLSSESELRPTARAALHGVVSSTYAAVGEFEDALSHARQAVSVSEGAGEASGERVIEYKNLVASQLISLSRYDEAERELDASLEAAGNQLGPEHPTTLSIRSNLALVLAERGAYDEAIQTHREVYETRSRVLGPVEESTITSLHHLAIEESAAGRYDDSLAHYREAAGLASGALGEEHPTTLSIRSGLAVAIEQQGDTRGSADLLRELVPIAERVWGPDHRDTNIMKTNLAFALDSLGEYEASLSLTREIYESSLRSLGASHTDTINARNGLAGALYRHADYAGAAALLEESRRAAIEAFGRLHVRSLDSGANLAQVLRRTDDLPRASEVAEEVLDDAHEYFGRENPELAWYTKVAGDIRYELGDAQGAVDRLEEARTLVMLQRDPGFLRSTLKSLARALIADGNTDRARQVVDECVTLMQELGDEESAIEEVRRLLTTP